MAPTMYETINPFTEELIESFGDHTTAELESVIAKAQETYENDWKLRSPAERKAIVKKAASIMRHKRDEFAKLVTLEMDKLIGEAQAEVDLSADILDCLPFGGVKDSGYGRELAELGIGEFVNKKLIRVAA